MGDARASMGDSSDIVAMKMPAKFPEIASATRARKCMGPSHVILPSVRSCRGEMGEKLWLGRSGLRQGMGFSIAGPSSRLKVEAWANRLVCADTPYSVAFSGIPFSIKLQVGGLLYLFVRRRITNSRTSP